MTLEEKVRELLKTPRRWPLTLAVLHAPSFIKGAADLVERIIAMRMSDNQFAPVSIEILHWQLHMNGIYRMYEERTDAEG